jgi:hypothetical protein
MKKYLRTCLILVIGVFLMAGCDEEVPEPPPPPDQGTPPSKYARLDGELGRVEQVTNGSPMGVGAYDYDNDTKPDIFQLMPDGRVILFLNKGDGIFEKQDVIAYIDPAEIVQGDGTVALAVDDFTEDGKPDLIVFYADGWAIPYIDVSAHLTPLRQSTDDLPQYFVKPEEPVEEPVIQQGDNSQEQ